MPSADHDPLDVVLCDGDDCAVDEASAHRKLRSALLDAGVELIDAPCLGVCHGPVVVIGVATKRPVVLERVRTQRARRAVVEAATGGPVDEDRLVRHEVGSAKRRRKAVRRARAAMADDR